MQQYNPNQTSQVFHPIAEQLAPLFTISSDRILVTKHRLIIQTKRIDPSACRPLIVFVPPNLNLGTERFFRNHTSDCVTLPTH